MFLYLMQSYDYFLKPPNFGVRKLAIFKKNYAKISRIAKNELFMSFSPQQR